MNMNCAIIYFQMRQLDFLSYKKSWQLLVYYKTKPDFFIAARSARKI
mgnify:CR=1 FL=1